MRTSVSLIHTQDLHCETNRPDGSLMPVDPGTLTGPNRGQSPLELLALAHGTCTAMMMVKAGKELGLDLAQMQVEVAHDYHPGPPMMLRSVHLRFHLPCFVSPGQNDVLQKGAKACPVHSSLRHDIPVTLELIPPKGKL